MKKLIIIVTCILCTSLYAKDDRATGIYDGVYHIGNHSSTSLKVNFKASAMAWKNICKSEMIDKLNFSKHYADLFSSVYLNSPDMKGVHKISQQLDKQMRQSCKDKGHFNFNIQNCYESCTKSYPRKTNFWKANSGPTMADLCTASCKSIDKDITTYHDTLTDVMSDSKFISATCPDGQPRVNQNSRKSVKEVDKLSEDTQEILQKGVKR